MQLLTQLNESINDKGLFKAVFVGGLPGAGKTYTISKITDGQIAPRIVSTDNYVDYMANRGVEGVEESDINRVTNSSLSHFISGMLPLMVDSTCTDTNTTITRVELLKSIGYDVSFVWIETSPDVAWNRIVERQKTSSRRTSREFFNEVVESISQSKEIISKAYGIIEIDNNDELNDDTIIKLYKQIKYFYSSPLQNEIGIKNIQMIRDVNQNNLTPLVYSFDYIKQLSKKWFT